MSEKMDRFNINISKKSFALCFVCPSSRKVCVNPWVERHVFGPVQRSSTSYNALLGGTGILMSILCSILAFCGTYCLILFHTWTLDWYSYGTLMLTLYSITSFLHIFSFLYLIPGVYVDDRMLHRFLLHEQQNVLEINFSTTSWGIFHSCPGLDNVHWR